MWLMCTVLVLRTPSESATTVQSTDLRDCWNRPQELTEVMSGHLVTGSCRAHIDLYRLQELTAVISGYFVTGNCRANIDLYRPQELTAVMSGYLLQETVERISICIACRS